MFYYIDQLCILSFLIGLVKTKSNFIFKSDETSLGNSTLEVAVISGDAFSMRIQE